jgi:hypothetical protein
MNALRKLAQFALECHHADLSRVFTIQKRTYRVCFKCGKEVDYSWEQMRSMEPNTSNGSMVQHVKQELAQTSII